MARTVATEIRELYAKQLQREAEEVWSEIEQDCLDWGLCERCNALLDRGWDLVGQAVSFGIDDYGVADEWELDAI